MVLLDFKFIAIFMLFLFISRTRRTSFVLLVAYFFYYNFALSFHGLYRYSAIAFIDLMVFLTLFDYVYKIDLSKFKNNSVGFFAMLAVWINFVGWVMYENYFSPIIYNNLCIMIMVLQVLALLFRIINNGRLVNIFDRNLLFCAFNHDNNKSFLQLQTKKNKGKK